MQAKTNNNLFISKMFTLFSVINLLNLLYITLFSTHSYILIDVFNFKIPVISKFTVATLGVIVQVFILVLYILFNRLAIKILLLVGLFASTGFASYLLGIQFLSEYKPCGNCVLSSILFISLFVLFLAQLFKEYIANEYNLKK